MHSTQLNKSKVYYKYFFGKICKFIVGKECNMPVKKAADRYISGLFLSRRSSERPYSAP